jgi:NAD(P) transhydrogenase subunit alpha
MALFAAQAKEVDIIITTALIPGKPAPKLITKEMVDSMKPGSIIVDMAAAAGGNCEYTDPGDLFVTPSGVKVIGYTDLPGRLPAQSSEMYATNLVNLAKLLSKEKDGSINIDFEDAVLRNMSVIHNGDVTFPPPAISVSAAPAQKQAQNAAAEKKEAKKPSHFKLIAGISAMALVAVIGQLSPQEFLSHLTVFALACIVGYYVVWNVTHSLHTPLMSVTNAISGIIILGALLQIGSANQWINIISFVSITIATVNIVGGFTVTHRMLKMFNKE